MDSNNDKGQIITFYSFKGGTGRTMALANVACLLSQKAQEAKNRKSRILMIDWDLEAPGLYRYFSDKYDHADDKLGLIDLFIALKAELDESPDKYAEENASKLFSKVKIKDYYKKTTIPYLYILHAGNIDDDYATKFNTFPWEEFFFQAPWLFPALANHLSDKFQNVLIDSRTGLSDISGICTMLMPDKLVTVFTPNRQSLYGVLDIVERAIEVRSTSNDLRPLSVFPLPSRIDDAEEELRKQWRDDYQLEFEKLFRKIYGLQECNLENYFDEVKLPYKSYYSYGEMIAVLWEREESLSLHRAYNIFTDLLVRLDVPWDSLDTPTLDPYMLYKQGVKFTEEGNYDQAIELLEQSINGYNSLNDERRKAIALGSFGNALLGLDRDFEAIETFQESINIFAELGDKKGQALNLTLLGLAYKKNLEIGNATRVLEQSINLHEELNDPSGKGLALVNLGEVLHLVTNFDEALNMFQQSLLIFEELEDRESVAVVLGAMGDVFQSEGSYSQAEEVFQRSLSINQSIKNKDGQARILRALGTTQFQTEKYSEAINNLLQSKSIFEISNDFNELLSTLYVLGEVYFRTLDVENAVRYFREALALSQQTGDRNFEARILNNLATTYATSDQLEYAIEYYKQAINLSQINSDLTTGSLSSKQLGNIYVTLGEFSNAIEYYELALSNSRTLGDRESEGTIFFSIGQLYESLGEKKKAISNMRQSLSILESIRSNNAVQVREQLERLQNTISEE